MQSQSPGLFLRHGLMVVINWEYEGKSFVGVKGADALEVQEG